MATPLKTAKHTKAVKTFCDSIFEIITTQQLILFAGAGVSVHAGLLDWRGFVAHFDLLPEI